MSDYYSVATKKDKPPSYYEMATRKSAPAPKPEPSRGAKVDDFFTGSLRQTRATQDLQSLADVGVKGFLGDKAGNLSGLGASAALVMTYSPEEAQAILSKAAGENVGLTYDEKGNAMLSLGDKRVLFNPPGFDKTDAAQLAGGAAAFTPAGRAGLAPVGAAKGIALVGAGSAATQGLVEAGQAAAGGTFDAMEIPIAGGLGAAGQAVASALVKLVPGFRQIIRESGITSEIRQTVRETAVKLGFKPEDVTDDFIRSVLVDAEQAVTPEEALAIAGEREFNIPLTAAERSLDQPALSAEDAFRSGARGQAAQRQMLDFEKTKQRPSVDEAVSRLQAEMGGSQVTPVEAGSVVSGAVRDIEAAKDAAVGAAYDLVGEAKLNSEGARGLVTSMRRAVASPEFDRDLKGTSFLLGRMKDLDALLTGFDGGTGRVRPFPIKQVEVWRRTIRSAAESAENPTDRRQVGLMREAFDTFMDKTVAGGLMSGDPQALAQMKNARGMMREYAELFYPQRKTTRGGTNVQDRAGNLLQEIIYSNPSDMEVVNTILGGQTMSSTGSVNIARRFKKVLGEDSDGWNAIRQAAFRRFIVSGKDQGAEVVSAERSLSRFNAALEKNPELVRELFSKDEISKIRRFLLTVKRTQPDLVRSRENPSGTAQVLVKSLADAAKRLGLIFGAAGDPTVILSSAGIEAASGIRASTQAKSVVRPFAPIISGRQGTELLPALAVPGVSQALEQPSTEGQR